MALSDDSIRNLLLTGDEGWLFPQIAFLNSRSLIIIVIIFSTFKFGKSFLAFSSLFRLLSFIVRSLVSSASAETEDSAEDGKTTV